MTAGSALLLVETSEHERENSYPARADTESQQQRREAPLFSFGAIADVQYADRSDGWDWTKTTQRYYRGGLRQLRRAVDVWLRDENHR